MAVEGQRMAMDLTHKLSVVIAECVSLSTNQYILHKSMEYAYIILFEPWKSLCVWNIQSLWTKSPPKLHELITS